MTWVHHTGPKHSPARSIQTEFGITFHRCRARWVGQSSASNVWQFPFMHQHPCPGPAHVGSVTSSLLLSTSWKAACHSRPECMVEADVGLIKRPWQIAAG